MEVKIYCLYNPQNLRIRYIGRTKSLLKKRLSQHITKAKYFKKYTTNSNGSYLINWINSLLKDGIKPGIKYLTKVEGWKESHSFEKMLIKKHFKKHNLVNGDDRGPGCHSKNQSKESLLRKRKKLKEYYSKEENKINFYNPLYVYKETGELVGKFKSTKFASEYTKVSENIISNSMSRFDNYNLKVNPKNGYYFSKLLYETYPLSTKKTYQSNHKTITIRYKETGEEKTFYTMRSFFRYFNLKDWDRTQFNKNIYTKRFKNLLEIIEICPL